MGVTKMKKSMSDSEMLLMKCIWDEEEDISIPHLAEVLREKYGKDYKRTTIVTFLSRLREKGYVQTYRKGRLSYAHPVQTEEEYRQLIAVQDTQAWFGGQPSRYLSALVDQNGLSKEEAERIREILDEYFDD